MIEPEIFLGNIFLGLADMWSIEQQQRRAVGSSAESASQLANESNLMLTRQLIAKIVIMSNSEHVLSTIRQGKLDQPFWTS